MSTPTTKQRGALLVLSMVIYLAAFHFWGPLVIVALGLLSRSAHDASPKTALLLGLGFGLSFAACFQIWALHYGLLAWLGLTIVRGLPWVVFTLLAAAKKPGPGLGSGFGLAGTSWLLLFGITGNDWEQPMAALALFPQLLSTLPWLGLTGAAFLLGLTADLMVRTEKKLRWTGVVILLSWTAVNLFLFPTSGQLPETKIGLVQTGWDQETKWDKEGQALGVERLFSLTTQAQEEGAELVVWPETAWPYRSMRSRPTDTRSVGRLARKLKIQLLASSLEDKKLGYWHNSVSQIQPTGRFEQEYRKVRLAPFAEYLPGPKALGDFLRKYRPFSFISLYQSGEGPVLFEVGEERYAVMVCYESMEPEYGLSVVEDVDFFVVVTNDAPLRRESAKEFHFRSAILRAAQFRKPILQASNNGVTGVIDNRGVVVWRTEPGFEGPTVLNGF